MSTFDGSFYFLVTHPVNQSIQSESSIVEKWFHVGPIWRVDLLGSRGECVTGGEDGRVNLVNLGESRLSYRCDGEDMMNEDGEDGLLKMKVKM
ncbi:hypothetical protein Sjap_026488 [Stephania japonica]|uniref:Uncharacterized protein n=1 Tax=Stephania japonica TaxID=461633 RepID=A0AAP0E743_9MAGN